jgi:hypothetical protein
VLRGLGVRTGSRQSPERSLAAMSGEDVTEIARPRLQSGHVIGARSDREPIPYGSRVADHPYDRLCLRTRADDKAGSIRSHVA